MNLSVAARGMRSEYDFCRCSYIRRGDSEPVNNHAFKDLRMSLLPAIGNIPQSMRPQNLLPASSTNGCGNG